MKTLDTIEGCDLVDNEDGSLTVVAPAMIDDDGSGDAHGDPDEQPDTSLHQAGRPLNADVDRYIVLPPQVIAMVAGIVLGCRVLVYNLITELSTEAVVGDIGPRSKIGEMSIACARAIGVPPSPTTGGEERHVIRYTFWPGIPACVEGKAYTLQPHP